MPSTSLIVPCFNYGRFLKSTLDSILVQTICDWECIIIDDGSSDNSAEIAGYYVNSDPRFTLISQSNLGVSAARNTGIKKAKGEWLVFLDADDLLEPRFLEVRLCYAQASINVDLISGSFSYFFDHNLDLRGQDVIIKKKRWPKLNGYGHSLISTMIIGNPFPVNAVLVRRSSILNIRGFDAKLFVLEDWDIWLRMAIANMYFGFVQDNNSSALIRIHNSSLSSQMKRMLDGEVILREKHQRTISDLNPLLGKENDRRRLHRLSRLVILNIMQLNIKSIAKLLRQISKEKGIGWIMYALTRSTVGLTWKFFCKKIPVFNAIILNENRII